ncbi:MAG: GNAT family N-acetyltransferase [Candidatus Altiarchaeota archaeon]|nr:GNAT family N-acetyltransferase [Candidatus Altiarchaeota archaeon]
MELVGGFEGKSKTYFEVYRVRGDSWKSVVPELNEIETEAFKLPKGRMEKLSNYRVLDSADFCLIVKPKGDNKIVAYIWGKGKDTTFHMKHSAVRSNYQRQGIGTQLKTQLIDQLKKDAVYSKIYVHAINNISATINEQVGFVKKYPFSYKDQTTWVMTKDL